MPHSAPHWILGLVASLGLTAICAAQGDSTVLRKARIHVRPGTVLEDADVLIEKDKIKAVGRELKAPEGATEIDLAGEDLYPGMIDPLNDGLLEPGNSARGAFGAGEPALDAFDAFQAVRNREMLAGGVLTVGLGAHPSGIRGGIVSVVAVGAAPGEPALVAKNQIVPCEISALERIPGRQGPFQRGGIFNFPDIAAVPTTSAMMRENGAKAIDELLEGGKRYREAWEKYEKDFAEYEKKLAEWEKNKGTESQPASRPAPEPERERRPEGRPPIPEGRPPGGRRGGGTRRGVPVPEPPSEPESTSAPSASGKPKAPEKPRVEPGKEALVRVIKREVPLWIVAHWASDIDAALDLAKKKNIRVVLAGATEACRRIDAIKDARIVVALGAPLSTDADSLDRLMQRDDLCATLARGGVPVTFFTAGDPAIGPAGLPLAAAIAIGCGMSEDAALAAVTSNAARALGVEKKIGTIEADRIASLFACRGSPFAPGARASRVWIQGKPVQWEQN